MSIHPDALDLAWLAQCCIGLQIGLTKPARGTLRPQHQAGVAEKKSATDAERECISALLAAMGQPRLQWQPAPKPDSLPMVALLPELGCVIVYAMTASGHWLLDTPSGRKQLVHLPTGAHYAAVGAPAPTAMSGSAYALFRQVLLSQREFFSRLHWRRCWLIFWRWPARCFRCRSMTVSCQPRASRRWWC